MTPNVIFTVAELSVVENEKSLLKATAAQFSANRPRIRRRPVRFWMRFHQQWSVSYWPIFGLRQGIHYTISLDICMKGPPEIGLKIVLALNPEINWAGVLNIFKYCQLFWWKQASLSNYNCRDFCLISNIEFINYSWNWIGYFLYFDNYDKGDLSRCGCVPVLPISRVCKGHFRKERKKVGIPAHCYFQGYFNK